MGQVRQTAPKLPDAAGTAAAVNSAKVLAHHEIGGQIYKACGGNGRAGYGNGLLQYLPERLTAKSGTGFRFVTYR